MKDYQFIQDLIDANPDLYSYELEALYKEQYPVISPTNYRDKDQVFECCYTMSLYCIAVHLFFQKLEPRIPIKSLKEKIKGFVDSCNDPVNLFPDSFFETNLYIDTLYKESKYMNPATGSVGGYDDWYYTNEDGEEVNAVDRGEVIEIE
jgi:hypothetical protein